MDESKYYLYPLVKGALSFSEVKATQKRGKRLITPPSIKTIEEFTSDEANPHHLEDFETLLKLAISPDQDKPKGG